MPPVVNYQLLAGSGALLDVDELLKTVTISTGGAVDSIVFTPQATPPTPEEGQIYYDADTYGPVFVNDKTSSALNIGREAWRRGNNDTGVPITNGQIVYIDGAMAGLPDMVLAQANAYDTSRVVAMCTEATIADGLNGEFTRFGSVGSLDTSLCAVGTRLWLSPTIAGAFTDTEPSGSDFIIYIGQVLVQDATEGVIDFSPVVGSYAAEVNKITGYADRSEQTASFVDATRILTISPTGSEYVFYEDGAQYRKTTDSIEITDVEGLHLVYYDGGTLVELVNPNGGQIDQIIRTKPLTQFVGWNATDSVSYYIGFEFHGAPNVSGMSSLTHAYLHGVFGGQWLSGGALNTMDVDGSGNDETAAQFGIDSGMIVDEDLPFTPALRSSTATIPIWYLSGTGADIREITQENAGGTEFFPVLADPVTGRLLYNENSGGTWQLTACLDKDFVLCHIFATNDLSRPYVAVMGQETYTDKNKALAGAAVEILTLTSGQLPTPEFVAFATVI